jgi:hypothetical protein
VTKVLAALGRHGFHAGRSPDTPCYPGDVALLTNVFFSGPRANSQDAERRLREGSLWCSLAKRPVGREAENPTRLYQSRTVGTGTHPGGQFFLANLDCGVYVTAATRSRIVGHLRAAMRELQRDLRTARG